MPAAKEILDGDPIWAGSGTSLTSAPTPPKAVGTLAKPVAPFKPATPAAPATTTSTTDAQPFKGGGTNAPNPRAMPNYRQSFEASSPAAPSVAGTEADVGTGNAVTGEELLS